MVSVLFLIFGFVDMLSGLGIILGSELILAPIAKYVGMIMLLKGIWTIITSLGGG